MLCGTAMCKHVDAEQKQPMVATKDATKHNRYKSIGWHLRVKMFDKNKG